MTCLPVLGGQELGGSGKVNRSERLINAVIANKPKALRGLDQKVRSTDAGLSLPPSWPGSCRRTGRTYPIRARKRNTVSPSDSLWESPP
jgi:hypothetical protein